MCAALPGIGIATQSKGQGKSRIGGLGDLRSHAATRSPSSGAPHELFPPDQSTTGLAGTGGGPGRPGDRSRAAAYDAKSAFPQASLDALQREGLFALRAPKAYGGLGADLLTTCLVVEAIAK